MNTRVGRRQFLAAMGAAGFFFTRSGAFAEELVLTPAQTIGPYYPDRLPLDQDNDLLIINDSITPAVGTVSWISGRVLDRRGDVIRGALVEIWQADVNGAYIHSQSSIRNRDTNFQGYGRFLTGSNGEYLFRTVQPGIYPGRTRHVHYQITLPGGQKLVTQLYSEGEAQNARDGVLQGIRDTAQRNSVIRLWTPIEGSAIGALGVSFDIVMGFTAVDNPEPARPAIVSMAGVVNAADEQPGAAAGSWILLFGEGLSATTRSRTADDVVDGKLPESLDGVSVRINDQPVPVDAVSPKQVKALAPASLGDGAIRVEVTNEQGTSDAVTADLKTYMPAFFEYAQEHIAAARPDGSLVGPADLMQDQTTTPAQPGETIVITGTGFGPTDPPAPAGQELLEPLPLSSPVRILIDGQPAEVISASLAKAGLYAFQIKVPELPAGDHIVIAEVSGVRTIQAVRLRIQ